MDLWGAISLLGASILLVFSLEEGGTSYPWNSAAIILPLVISCFLWTFFVFWEKRVEQIALKGHSTDPIFPWRLTRNRFFLGAAV